MKISDLPPELLQFIVSLLSPKDICRVRLTCSELRDVCDLETVWTKLCLRHHGMLLPVKDEFSPKAFYQKILHKYGPAIGYWQEMDNGHYGGLLKAHFTESNTTFKLIKLKPEYSDLSEDLILEEWISITLEKGNISIKSENLENAIDNFLFEDGGLSLTISHQSLIGHWSQWSTVTGKFNLQKVLTPEWISKYHGDHSSGNPQLNALAPGIFKGEYGSHGVELIHLLDGQGVKVTGDDNVPFNKVTFRVTFGQKMNIPVEMQTNLHHLIKVTENKNDFENYMVPPGEQDDDDLTYDFQIPPSMYCEGDITWDKCRGRWLGEAQVAGSNYHHPSFIPANFILFNEDEFAVMFLGLNCISMYKRVKSI